MDCGIAACCDAQSFSMSEGEMSNPSQLEEKIEYHFRDQALLTRALTHSSRANEEGSKSDGDNERLEFLGDAVLELCSSSFLFRQYPDLTEGELTRLRASLVCEPTLALCAGELGLGAYLLLGKGEEHSGGRERASVLSDALEALIGAVYLDGGLSEADRLITRWILTDIESKQLFHDSKTILQERVQAELSERVRYRLLEETGPDHDRRFTVEVQIGEKSYGRGTGRSKKAAEQEAAFQTLRMLG